MNLLVLIRIFIVQITNKGGNNSVSGYLSKLRTVSTESAGLGQKQVIQYNLNTVNTNILLNSHLLKMMKWY